MSDPLPAPTSPAARRPGAPPVLASEGAAPVRREFLPIAVPDIGARERELVLEALESGWITNQRVSPPMSP